MKQNRNRLIPLLLGIALLLVSCGGHEFWAPPGENNTPTNPTGAVPKFAYVANLAGGGAGSVSAYTVNSSTGTLSEVKGSPFSAGNGTIAVGTDSAGKFVYAANQASNNVSGYTINRNDGTLTQVSGSPFSAGTSPAWVAVDPGGRFVYVVNGGSNDISLFSVNSSSGALSANGTNVSLPATPLRATIDPSGRFLYVSMSTAGTAVYLIGTDGKLTAGMRVVPATPCAASDDITVDANTRYAFVVDGVNTICAYAVNANTGDLIISNSPTTAAASKPVAVASGGAGKFLFAANNASSNMSGYVVNADGTLAVMSSSPFGAAMSPADVTVDPSGTFVYVANSGSNNVSIFKISSNTVSSVGTATAGTNPNSVVVTP